MSDALLVADCVTKRYGERRVLSSASLRAVPCQVRALLGRNGSGKSTLMKIAAGLARPDNGHVAWDGVAAGHHVMATLATRGLFYLPDHDLLSAAFPVRRQLEMVHRRFGGLAPEDAAARMGVGAVLDQRPTALSGGERRRAELAMAFARGPRCLLADEPFRGIAPRDAEVLVEAFRALAASGVAVVVTGHEVDTLLDAADHVTWCTSGTTYELGAPAEARGHDRFRREYLGAPPLAPRDGAG